MLVSDIASPEQQIKRVGRPPKENTVKMDAAQKEFEKLKEHKRAVGVIMDRQGVVLASDARRKTFLGGEDFEDMIEGSD